MASLLARLAPMKKSLDASSSRWIPQTCTTGRSWTWTKRRATPQGEVEFSADLYLLKPKDMAKGNQAVLFEVSNRGGRGILSIVNGREGEFGDGFLMRQGYTVAWVGWQFDLSGQPGRMRLSAPVAHDAGGKEIHGLVRTDFTPAEKRDDMPLGHILLGPDGGNSYPVDDPASEKNRVDRPRYTDGREEEHSALGVEFCSYSAGATRG